MGYKTFKQKPTSSTSPSQPPDLHPHSSLVWRVSTFCMYCHNHNSNCGQVTATVCYKKQTVHMKQSWDRMKEQMRDTDQYTNNWYRFHCQMAKYIIFTKVDSRQSHLMGKSDILEGISTDQLPMVVTMGSSAAGTRTENTEVLLSCVYRAHCANAFRISSSNSSSAIKSHALQAGITSLVVNYTELCSAAFVVWSCIIQWRWFVNTCVCTWRQR